MVISVPGVKINCSGEPESKGGANMPLIGFGTAGGDADATKAAILDAIKVGYRHFDTAYLYGSEKPLGDAVAEAVREGLIESREELFITSKLWCTFAERDLVVPAVKASLENLQMEYVDLFLVHFPLKLSPEARSQDPPPVPEEYIHPIDIKAVWERMEECQRLGLTKFIGVSNFSIRRLQETLQLATIPPAVNQVEVNPMWQQKELREFCKQKGIQVTAYSPLGANNTDWGDNRILTSDVLQEIAQAKGKTIAQVALRWVYEQDVSLIDVSQVIDLTDADAQRPSLTLGNATLGPSTQVVTLLQAIEGPKTSLVAFSAQRPSAKAFTQPSHPSVRRLSPNEDHKAIFLATDDFHRASELGWPLNRVLVTIEAPSLDKVVPNWPVPMTLPLAHTSARRLAPNLVRGTFLEGGNFARAPRPVYEPRDLTQASNVSWLKILKSIVPDALTSPSASSSLAQSTWQGHSSQLARAFSMVHLYFFIGLDYLDGQARPHPRISQSVGEKGYTSQQLSAQLSAFLLLATQTLQGHISQFPRAFSMIHPYKCLELADLEVFFKDQEQIHKALGVIHLSSSASVLPSFRGLLQ